MNEPDDTEPPPFITLDLDTGSREFDDVDELAEWAKEQREAVGWLQNATKNQGNIQQAWNVLNDSIGKVENFCNRYPQLNDQQQRAESQNLKKHFTNTVQSGKIQTRGSADLSFVDSLRKQHSDIVAAHAYAFLTNHDFQIASAASFAGAHLAMRYQLGGTDTVAAQKKSLESVKQSWSVRFGKLKKRIESEAEAFRAELTDRKASVDTLVKELEDQKKEQRKSFDKICEDATSQLESITQTYDEKLALQSSVSYWGLKKRSHNRVMWVTGITSVVVGAATAAGFIAVAHEFLQEPLERTEIWRFGVLVAVSTFGVWLTRLFGKIFIANLHLRTDAQERETMILTYLAMLREGDVLKSDERELILQVVFRPSTTGYIKEEGPTGFGDMVASMLKRK